MKLSIILSACNTNIFYMDYIPIFINAWNKLYPSVDVKIVLIANSLPTKLAKYIQNIILFSPILNISTAFISQYIRILYPSLLNSNEGVLITDIDMIPLNNFYYTKNIQNISDDKFISLHNSRAFSSDQLRLCYNIATPAIWKEVNGIKTIADINRKLANVYKNINYSHGSSGWFADQKHLYNLVTKWNKVSKNFVHVSNDIQNG